MPATTNVLVKIDAKDNASRVLGGLGKSLKGFGQAASSVGRNLAVGITAPIVATGFAIAKLAERAGKVESVTDAFQGMIKGYEIGGSEMIANIKKATSGTVDQFQIMTNFMKASSLIGKEALGESGKNFERFAIIAKKAARVTGKDVDFMFESIVNGIGRTSTKWLDNTTIVVGATEAYKIYAEEMGKSVGELTEVEKKIALTNLFLETAEERFKDVAVTAGGYSSSLARLKVKLTETADEIGLALIPAIQEIVESITPLIKEHGPKLAKFISDIAKGFADLEPNMQAFILGSIALVTILGPLLMIVGGIASGISALSILFSPLALIIAGLVAWFFILKDSFKKGAEGIRYWKDELIPAIIAKFEEWKEKVRIFIESLITWFSELPGKVMEFIRKLFIEDIPFAIGFVIGWLSVKIPEIIGNIITWFSELPGKVKAIFEEVKEKIIEKLTAAWEWVKTEVPTWPGKIKAFLEPIPGKIAKVLSDLIKTIADKLLDAPGSAWKKILDFKDKVVGAFNAVRDAINDVIDALKGGIRAGISAASGGESHQTGGVVSGPIGAAVPIVAHAGERILPAGVAQPVGGTGGGLVFEVNIGLYAGTETEKREIAKELYAALVQVGISQNKTVAELLGG